MGFFKAAELFAPKPQSGSALAALCSECRLYRSCETPKMAVSGGGRLKTLIVAEAPGKDEDRRGTQFVGAAGNRLRDTFRLLNVDLVDDCWRTNALICRPPKNRTPTPNEIEFCRPNLVKAVEELRPERIILLGGVACDSFMGHYWRGRSGLSMTTWAGWKIPHRALNAWVCPTYHPSYLLREKDPLLDLWFERHLREAFELEGRPWETVPDYESKLELIYDSDDAALAIAELMETTGRMAAFDYETNMLKPDSGRSEIVCCSIAVGKKRVEKCISYPMVGRAKEMTKTFLKSRIPKIASNMKFEDRWTRRHFGSRVRNWAWDTMQAAHVLDNRQGITSIKFQAFVQLGYAAWNERIEPFLREETGNGVNRVREIPIESLLRYCGLDSLLEFEVAVKQMRQMGAPPPWRSEHVNS